MYIEMSDKVSLYVKQSGNGIPCVFIHGGPGEGSLDFEALGGSLVEDFMNITYFDQRGCARSAGSEKDDYSIKIITKDIEEIRIKLGISKWIVMAHSFGGIIAVNYAYKYEKYVDKLILMNSTLSMNDSFKNQAEYGESLLGEESPKYPESISILEKWQVIVNKLIEKNLFYKLQYNEYENFVKVNAISEQIENFNTAMARQAFSNKDYFINYFDLTKKITIPVLVITGSKDYAIGPDHYKNFLFPNMTVKIMDGKHMLYLENNKELRTAIEEFLLK